MRRFLEPEGISIDICSSCNNNCIFCVNTRDDHKHKDLSLSEVNNMVSEVRKFSDGIIINGGEPTMRNDIVDLIQFAKRLKFKSIMLISNGRMFSYKEFCKTLIKAGLNLVFVTLQASCAELHDKQTCVKSSFKQTLEGIRNLKNYGIDVCTNTVINSLNYKDMPSIPLLLDELNVDLSKFSYMRIKGNAEQNKDWLVVKIGKTIPYIRKAAHNFIRLKKDFMIQEIPFCVLKSHFEYIRKGLKMPVLDIDRPDLDSFMKKYYRGGNIKSKNCVKCMYYRECMGPWEEYIKYFGWDEFKPIRGD